MSQSNLRKSLTPVVPDRAKKVFLGLLMFSAVSVSRMAAQFPSEQQTVDCSDPSHVGTALCPSTQSTLRTGETAQMPTASDSDINAQRQTSNPGVYLDSAGLLKSSEQNKHNNAVTPKQPEPLTDFQQLVRESTDEVLPIFGRELFAKPISTFAPADQLPVDPNYVIGPGDELIIRVWGHNTFNGRLTVDRSGTIYVPQVGAVHVAGLQFSDLQGQLQRDLSRVFRNFELSVNLGQLRSIQVYVLGEAQHPGSYNVSSLSTAFNALLVSGGPTVNGSMRAIRVIRNGQTLATVDLYDIIVRGDKSKDVLLQSGDVLFIPVPSLQVALGGSVRRPAIYEAQPDTTVGDLLSLAGGLSSTASGGRISIERISDRHDREALSFELNAAGLATKIADGDVLHVNSILASYKDSVTIRGNLANPGRFAFHAGMKLSEIIPDRESLLTNEYWKRRNHLGIPIPLFEPQDKPSTRTMSRQDLQQNGSSDMTERNRNTQGQVTSQDQLNPLDFPPAVSDGSRQGLSKEAQLEMARKAGQPVPSNDDLGRRSLADQQMEAHQNMEQDRPRTQVRVPYPEIDWSYAVIERLDPMTLRSSLIPFNLGKLVMDHDGGQDLTLHAGDIVTVLSQSDIHVSEDEQTKYVRLEGEFVSSGVYSVAPNETLADVVRRAGGFTSKVYLYGATFTRESARVMQQNRLNDYIDTLSIQIERASSERVVSSSNPLAGTGDLDSERALIQQLRAMRATGRIVLEFKPESAGVASVPALPLENGDVFRVPSKPMVVSVVGAVYGQNVFLYNADRHTRDYLTLAGKPNRIADRKHEFIIRADGSIFSRETSGALWSDHFDTSSINPGDTIVVPEKPVRPSVLKDVIDWSQVFSQFALGAAAIQVIR